MKSFPSAISDARDMVKVEHDAFFWSEVWKSYSVAMEVKRKWL